MSVEELKLKLTLLGFHPNTNKYTFSFDYIYKIDKEYLRVYKTPTSDMVLLNVSWWERGEAFYPKNCHILIDKIVDILNEQ